MEANKIRKDDSVIIAVGLLLGQEGRVVKVYPSGAPDLAVGFDVKVTGYDRPFYYSRSSIRLQKLPWTDNETVIE